MSETPLGIGTTSSRADATALNCDDGGHRGQPELLRVPGGQGHPRCAFVPRPPARRADGFVVTTNRRIVDADNSDADARLPTQLPQAIPGTSTPRGISSSPSRAIPRTRATTRALRRSARRRRTSPPTPSPRRSTRSRTRRTRHPPTKSPDGTGGGYWIASSSKSGSTSKPFIARSTYSHELCEPRVRGGVVRPVQPSRPATRMDAAGAAPARLDDVSRYERDFGADPLARAPPPNAAGIGAGLSQRATTSDLTLGTTRATRHVPGYAGFVARPA